MSQAPLYAKASAAQLVEDPLDPKLLTPQVWKELFDIFQRHFAADLPFLHATTFLKPLRQTILQSQTTAQLSSSQMPPHSPSLLLAFLALTSKFHPGLIAHHAAPVKQDKPLIVAEFYAKKARMLLNDCDKEERLESKLLLDRTQAFLMLSLHEWGMNLGAKAWLTIQSALSLAHIQGLPYEDDFDDMKEARIQALDPNVEYIETLDQTGRRNPAKSTTLQEIQRRTMWSCFIMDRYLSSGKRQPSGLNVRDLRLPLPCSDEAFTFGKKVKTLLLEPDEDRVQTSVDAQRFGFHSAGRMYCPEYENGDYDKHYVRSSDRDEHSEPEAVEAGGKEGILSCSIRARELFGEVLRWSCKGGRRSEQEPPWSEKSTSWRLERKLERFTNNLPEAFRLSDQNVDAHAQHKSSTAYILMHLALLLCPIMLHREPMPFTPFEYNEPKGPLDEVHYTEEQLQTMRKFYPDYWARSAEKCFKATRQILDLLRACQENGVWVETPLSGFSAYQVAIVAVYSLHFPNMDQHGYICRPKSNQEQENRPDPIGAVEAAGIAMRILQTMGTRLMMARAWCITIKKLNRYFHIKWKAYRRTMSISSHGSSSSSYREDGGLGDYKKMEEELKGMNSMSDYDQDMEWQDGDVDFEKPSEPDSELIKQETERLSNGVDRTEDTPESTSAPSREAGFTSINAKPEAARDTPSAFNEPRPYLDQQMPHHASQPEPTAQAEYRDPYAPYPIESNVPHYYHNAPESATRHSLQHSIGSQSVGVAGVTPEQAPIQPATFMNLHNQCFGGWDVAHFVGDNGQQDNRQQNSWPYPAPDDWTRNIYQTVAR